MASNQVESIDLVDGQTVRQLSAAVMFAALTAVLAQFSIDLPGGVPFSFQPFAVFFAGLVLGPVWGGFSLTLYFLVGLAGAPVFSNAGAGVGYVLGPTGGFLIGFVVAAALIGFVAHRSLSPGPIEELSPISAAVALLAGLAVIYLAGVPWLASVNGLPLTRAASIMAPFVVGDLIKIGLTVGIVAGGNELLADWR
ncbi:biotin transporter BioY [Halonotius terrestris]|uniref:Biotin transporter BioY n=1 Tax=Halonotius terrestris TaxID=2487750 RepID=A0A8J8TBY5_9EURY|nr:biotin transporter BioY [Halonotius terrestris]TQQ82860.1 biotin transporter BioY [Halonotius terrestris]